MPQAAAHLARAAQMLSLLDVPSVSELVEENYHRALLGYSCLFVLGTLALARLGSG